MVFNNVILQTSTSVKQTLAVAVLMPFVTTPTVPSIAHVNLDIKEMEKTAQVIFIFVSGLLAWHQKLLVFAYLFAVFSFISLTTYFGCSYKRTSVGLPLSRQLIGIHRANMMSDIDECEGETHNCSSNAVCNTTKGSCNCTRKPGYEGDGTSCTGNFFHKFVLFAGHQKHCRLYFSMIRCSL